MPAGEKTRSRCSATCRSPRWPSPGTWMGRAPWRRSPRAAGSFGGPHVRERCDVLVTHEPPAGTLDRAWSGQHIGARRVRDLVARLRPRVLTCGHVHESPGIARVGETLVINCTMGDGRTHGALIELGPADVDARLL